ncbi:hypothetical protein OG911_28130 [Streptomyces sp. NBC_00208]|uniref:hypothetical protein n=1 Tax=Streptomyces sp. NBC_00208 TaxID=2975681 RepID=UPI002E27BDF5|nr:hypothetical protein [Streptomyces sp. NBC_00208]
MAGLSALQACTAWLHTASLPELRVYIATGHRPGGTVDLRSAAARRADARRELGRRTRTRVRSLPNDDAQPEQTELTRRIR